MALVVKAFILCATDDPTEAESAVFAALNSGVFESASPILDFAMGVDQKLAVANDYQDGSFVRQIPDAALLRTVNSVQLPC